MKFSLRYYDNAEIRTSFDYEHVKYNKYITFVLRKLFTLSILVLNPHSMLSDEISWNFTRHI
jgi:hypothetical protein